MTGSAHRLDCFVAALLAMTFAPYQDE